jgi:hypothetical protein
LKPSKVSLDGSDMYAALLRLLQDVEQSEPHAAPPASEA